MNDGRRRLALAVCFVAALVSVATAYPARISAAASTTTLNYTIPIDDTYYNFCTGERIATTGEFHIVVQQVTDASGATHLTFVGNTVNMQGIGDQGNTYRVSGILRQHNSPVGPAPWVYQYTDIFNLISKGGTVDFHYQVEIHMTIDANGTLTAAIENVRATCPI